MHMFIPYLYLLQNTRMRIVAFMVAVMTVLLCFSSKGHASFVGQADEVELKGVASKFLEKVLPKLADAKKDDSYSQWLLEPEDSDDTYDPWERVSEEDELIFSLVKGSLIFSETLFIQKKKEGVYLSLLELLTSLDFPIELDFEGKKASGWFIRENKTIEVDFATGVAVLEGQEISMVPEDYYFDDGNYDIFIKDSLVKRLFGIELLFNVQQLQADIISSELLPIEEKILRRERKGTIIGGATEPILPRVKQEPELITQPFVDAQYLQSFTRTPDDGTDLQGNYSIIAANDFLYGGTQTFIAGDEEDAISQLRFTWTREADEGEDLGFLGVDRVRLGDIIPTRTNIFDGAGQEFGFRLDSHIEGTDNELTDVTEFEGDIPPGWDIELYNNDVLIDTQEASLEGRYLFEDVQLNFGENNFRLVFYGPQGQIQEQTRTILRNKSPLNVGESSYSFSVTNRGEVTFDSDSGDIPDQGTPNIIGLYERGITKNLLLSLGSRYHQNNDEDNIQTSLGLTNFGDTGVYEFNVGVESQGGLGFEATALTKILGQDVRLRHQANTNDFDTTSPESDNIVSLTEATVRGDLAHKTTYNTSAQYLLQDGGAEAIDFNASVAKRFHRGVGTLSYDFNRTESGGNATENQSVSLNGTYNLGGAFLRGNVTYSLVPEFEAVSYLGSLVTNFNNRLGGQFEVEQFVGDNRTEGRVRLNFRNDNVIISPDIQYDSDDELQALLTVRLGFGQDPYSGRTVFSSNNLTSVGGVSSRVFLDENNNGIWDGNEEAISGAEIKAQQAGRRTVTDENGIAFLPNLGQGVITDVSLNEDTLEDPYFLTTHKGNSVKPRAGRVTPIDFPVVISGEIDGVVSLVTKNGVVRPSRKMIVQLIDDNGEIARTVETAYDGFFVMGDIEPGQYRLTLSSDVIKKRNMIPVEPIGLNFSAKGDVFFDQGFTSFSRDIDPILMQSYVDNHPDKMIVMELGRFQSRLLMMVSWLRMRQRFSPYFEGMIPVQKLDQIGLSSVDERYPLHIGPVIDISSAEQTCEVLNALGQTCSLKAVSLSDSDKQRI
jgi:hypothetical protein